MTEMPSLRTSANCACVPRNRIGSCPFKLMKPMLVNAARWSHSLHTNSRAEADESRSQQRRESFDATPLVLEGDALQGDAIEFRQFLLGHHFACRPLACVSRV